MRLRTAAAAASVACLLPALAACGGGGTQSHAGDVVPARQDKQFVHAKGGRVATPIGTLEIHAAKPVEEIASKDTLELTEQKAPAGMAYLPITWRLDPGPAKPYATFVETSALPVIDLRAGGDSYRLQTPDADNGTESFYVLVKQGEGHPTVRVGFDGVDQTLDLTSGKRDAGKARDLYKLSSKPLRPSKCTGAVDWSEIAVATGNCKVTGPVRLPYAAGRWAKPGKPWLALSVKTSLQQFTQAGDIPASAGIYAVQGVTTTYRLGKQKPVEVIPSDNDSNSCPDRTTGACNTNAALIFRSGGPTRALKVTETYRMVLIRGYGGFDGRKNEKVRQTTGLRLKAPR